MQPRSTWEGREIGRYRVLRRLALGGTAEIYLAEISGIEGFSKHVVLKRLHPAMQADHSAVRSFLDEARLGGQLQHHNIAQVYDIGRVGDEYFFSMECLHGRDLESILTAVRNAGRRIPFAHAVRIILEIAAALQYAHDKVDATGESLHIVHRDVSPSNVVVTFDGAVKLLDFGIAKARSSSQHTAAGVTKGKTMYMSPEQCSAGTLDRRSDLFSLGVVLYELTTGVRPFEGVNDFMTMAAIIDGPLRPPSDLEPRYPAELENIVKRALERRPDDRYQSADELRRDLERFAIQSHQTCTASELREFMVTTFEPSADAWHPPLGTRTQLTTPARPGRPLRAPDGSQDDAPGPRANSRERALLARGTPYPDALEFDAEEAVLASQPTAIMRTPTPPLPAVPERLRPLREAPVLAEFLAPPRLHSPPPSTGRRPEVPRAEGGAAPSPSPPPQARLGLRLGTVIGAILGGAAGGYLLTLC